MSDEKPVTSDLKPVTEEEIQRWKNKSLFMQQYPDSEWDTINRLIADRERARAALRKLADLVAQTRGECPLEHFDEFAECPRREECDDDYVGCWMDWARRPTDTKGEAVSYERIDLPTIAERDKLLKRNAELESVAAGLACELELHNPNSKALAEYESLNKKGEGDGQDSGQ